MVKLGAPVRIHPLDALLSMLHLSAGHAQWLNAEIAALDDLSTPEGHALVALYGEERDRVAKVAKACLDAGVAERQVRLAEQYGVQLAQLLQSIFNDPELRLDPGQRAALRTILPRHLADLEPAKSNAA